MRYIFERHVFTETNEVTCRVLTFSDVEYEDMFTNDEREELNLGYMIRRVTEGYEVRYLDSVPICNEYVAKWS